MTRSPPFVLAPVVALTFMAGLGSAAGQGDSTTRGTQIAQAADRSNQGFAAERATMAMELINAHGDVSRRKLVLETLEGTSDGDRTRVAIEWPADVRGTKLLTWNHRDREDDQWLYMPAIKRVRRIGGGNRRGAFVGSELSYEDLAGSEIERFRYRYLDEPAIRGRPTFRLERVPVDPDSGYSRQIVWLDKEYQNPLRVEYYDRSKALLKTATFEGYRRHGQFWRASTVRMENVQTRKVTIIRWEDRQLGVRLPAESFDSARLGD